MINQSVIARLLKDQSGCCWHCGRDLYKGYEIHHCCYSRDVRFAKWLDTIFNLVALCPKCHRSHGKLSNIDGRRKFFKMKVEQGYQMREWEMSIPFVVHDRFEDN